jgi:hypothetical protein
MKNVNVDLELQIAVLGCVLVTFAPTAAPPAHSG